MWCAEIIALEHLVYNTTAESNGEVITWETVCQKYHTGECVSVYSPGRMYGDDASLVPDGIHPYQKEVAMLCDLV